MKYTNAQKVLPKKLLEDIQFYTEGTYLYIPRQSPKKNWGEATGSRVLFAQRNEHIKEKWLKGDSVRQLAKEYFLSESSIRKIIKSQ